MKKALLINLSVWETYKSSKLKIGLPVIPPLNIATLAGSLAKENIDVMVVDLNVQNLIELRGTLKNFQPDYVGISVMTPSYNQLKPVIKEVRELTNAKVILGGPHISTYPEQTLKEIDTDTIVIGEGDILLPYIINNNLECTIFRQKEFLNLDEIPFPKWDVFKLNRYKAPKVVCRRRPVAPMETSRGCPFQCTYCNKNIFGCSFRPKSAERVVDEIEYNLKQGFKELHIIDDGFSTDITRAKKICDLIIKSKLDFTWNIRSGMRADRCDEELLEKMKKAGCYRISFGVESGSQEILNLVKKGIKIETIKKTIKMAKKVGFETLAFFMLGIPGETEETMKQTIRFAKELDPYIVKPSIFKPMPGTPLFDEIKEKGLIKINDWSKYSFDNAEPVFDHPTLKWETIQKYYDKFYREFYFRPGYITKRLIHDIRHRTIFTTIGTFFKIEW